MTTRNESAVSVRDAVPDDLDFVVDCNLRLARESENKTLDRSVLARGVRRALTSPELCRYFIAEVDGRPVATTMVTYELTDWRDGVIWWLQSVYVVEDFRNRGVFRSVHRYVDALARRTDGVCALRLYVKDDNRRAIRTYEAVGMVDAGYRVLEDDWSHGPTSPDL